MPLKRRLFIAVVECAIKKKLRKLSIETWLLSFAFQYIKINKEKAQKIEHRNISAFQSLKEKLKIKKKLRKLSIETFVLVYNILSI